MTGKKGRGHAGVYFLTAGLFIFSYSFADEFGPDLGRPVRQERQVVVTDEEDSGLSRTFDNNQGQSGAGTSSPVRPGSSGQAGQPTSQTHEPGDVLDAAVTPGIHVPEPVGARFTGTLEDHRAEFSVDYLWDVVRAGLRSGVVSGTNLFGGPGIPYAVLQPSLYITGSVTAEHNGENLDAMAQVSGSYLYMLTEQSILDPGQSDYASAEEELFVGSAYGDVIYAFRVSPDAAIASFAGASLWDQGLAGPGGQWIYEGNAGIAGGLNVSESDTVHAWTQLQVNYLRTDSYQNQVPDHQHNHSMSFDGLESGVDYTHRFDSDSSLRLWAQYEYRDPYQLIEGGADYTDGPFGASVAGHYQDTDSPWFANEFGAAARAGYQPFSWLGFDLTGFWLDRSDIDDRPLESRYGLTVGLSGTFDTDGSGYDVDASVARQRSGTPNSQDILDGGYHVYDVNNEFTQAFDQTVSDFEDFASFADNLPVNSVDDILQAGARMAAGIQSRNYNHNELPDNVLRIYNADDTEEIYDRWRQSYLTGEEDPTTVCIGAAQVVSQLVMRLGRRLGINIEAAPVDVVVRGGGSILAGHAISMIRIPERGFVFVDWGNIIPTYTHDPETALAVYDGLVGSAAVFHNVRDAEHGGRYVGRIYMDQGRPILEATSILGDPNIQPRQPDLFDGDPRSSDITRDRALDSVDDLLLEPGPQSHNDL
ncbi:MAG: hypothetical protein HY747_06210 [Elusimicrobia bacterium]|nr:hypothetical protein [Elusimicrobiota bacterium]